VHGPRRGRAAPARVGDRDDLDVAPAAPAWQVAVKGDVAQADDRAALHPIGARDLSRPLERLVQDRQPASAASSLIVSGGLMRTDGA